MSVFVFKWCNFFAPTSEIYFTIWWKTLHHAKVAKTTVLYGFFGVFGSCSLSSYISIQTFYLLTFVWIKEKANAKGNGDWHLRGSRFCKKDMRGFLSFTTWACFALVPADSFCFSARVCGEKILNMQRGFLFHELPAILPRNALGVFIADRSVKRSVLVCWLFRRQSNKKGKDRGSVLSCLGLWRGVE